MNKRGEGNQKTSRGGPPVSNMDRATRNKALKDREVLSTVYAKFTYSDGYVEEKSMPGNACRFYGIKHAGTRPIRVELTCETRISNSMLKSLLYVLHPINREIIINGENYE